MAECNANETHNIYPKLYAVPLSETPLNDQQQFRLSKSTKLETILLLRLMKEN